MRTTANSGVGNGFIRSAALDTPSRRGRIYPFRNRTPPRGMQNSKCKMQNYIVGNGFIRSAAPTGGNAKFKMQNAKLHRRGRVPRPGNAEQFPEFTP